MLCRFGVKVLGIGAFEFKTLDFQVEGLWA